MLERVRKERANMLRVVNGKLKAQDLTTDPKIKVKDSTVDLVICFEMLEHIKPEFVAPILEEVNRVLSPEGVALFSTPNSLGATTSKLPADHVYEWAYDELVEKMQEYLTVESTHGIGVNVSKIPKGDRKKYGGIIDSLSNSFGKNTYFTSTVLAAFCEPEYCKNVLYVCRKQEDK